MHDKFFLVQCILAITTMRVTHLRQADLNLLVVFTALAEERNVSRAAERLSLSQPAVTRAMQRLREMFQDDLLVRVSGDYALTPKGERLLQEVETMLPRLDRLLAGGDFRPAEETAHFRLAGTDYASHVIGVPLARCLLEAGRHLRFEFSPLRDEVFDLIERGRIDLILHADDDNIPSHLSRQAIFEEEFICVVAQSSFYGDRLTLDQYLNASHVGVTIFGGSQTIPDQRLAENGLKRQIAFGVPFFAVAMHMVGGTDLIATVPKRMAMFKGLGPDLRFVNAPEIMGKFTYQMIWHPRMESDAAHLWLRKAVQKVSQSIQNEFYSCI